MARYQPAPDEVLGYRASEEAERVDSWSRTSPNPKYIVVRVAPSYPHQVPPDLDGMWYDVDTFQVRPPVPGGATLTETARFEEREDGELAQVYELRG
jgi:hypothetical protein